MIATPAKPLFGWSDFLRALEAAEEILADLYDPGDVEQQQEGVRLLAMRLAQGYTLFLHQDFEQPDWIPYLDNVHVYGAPNPDFTYLSALVDSNGVYRIAGDRGTTLFLNINVMSYIAGLDPVPGPSVGDIDADELTIRPGGKFEVVLSRERPQGYTGDWVFLDERARALMVRQCSYDWLNEVEGRLTIERLDVPPRGVARTTEELAQGLEFLARYPGTYAMIKHVAELRGRNTINAFEFTSYGAIGGVDKQFYYEGLFDIAPDEALIIETEIPERVRYWSLQLADLLFNGLDWFNCQSGLNGHQARLDSDGKFRAALAMSDPGVPNWIDTVGHRKGLMIGRWTDSDSSPTPTVTRVPLSDVREYLPAETPVVTPEEREHSLRLRRRGAQLRRRW
jgi:hypothetical protein